MSQKTPQGVYDVKQYREHTRVFRDRVHAGDVLARMLHPFRQDAHLVLGIPAGGVPVDAMMSEVDAVFCPNIRSGLRYAVADAYKRWSDVDESEVMKILFGNQNPP
ncbi:MAG: hypothetical protein WBB70_12210 [Desulfobacterales bacterium]